MARAYMLAQIEEERLKVLHKYSQSCLRINSAPMLVPEGTFIAKYRLTKAQFRSLCNELMPLLPDTYRSSAIRPELKILAAIEFYAHGSYQKSIGPFYDLALCQTAVSDCLRDVTNALNTPEVLRRYIKFPMTQTDRESIMRRFMDQFGFPGVVGCIDGTHVAIIRPTDNEEAYFNRKLYHSLNVLIICDADLRILHIDASFGGASHDSHIWNSSPVKEYMERLHAEGNVCWLLGDSGYAQREWMMPPILNAVPDSPEDHYTWKHVRTRNVVERCIGVLKTRWRCLLSHRVVHYIPVKAGKIVNACVVLHNLINDNRLDIDMVQIDFDQGRQPANEPVAAQFNVSGSREALIQRLWRSRIAH